MGSSLNETDFSNDTHLSMGGAKRVVEAIKKTSEKNNNNTRHQQGCHRKKNRHPHFSAQNVDFIRVAKHNEKFPKNR